MSRSRHSSIVSLGVTHSASGISLLRVVDFISLAQCSKVYFSENGTEMDVTY